jgi:hypothetical protein
MSWMVGVDVGGTSAEVGNSRHVGLIGALQTADGHTPDSARAASLHLVSRAILPAVTVVAGPLLGLACCFSFSDRQGAVIAYVAFFVDSSATRRYRHRIALKKLIAFSIVLCSRVVVHTAGRVYRTPRFNLRNRAVPLTTVAQHADGQPKDTT